MWKIAVLVVLLAGCEPPVDGAAIQSGSWYSVRPPPNAPEGTTCWVWSSTPLFAPEQTYGGPVCFPVKEVTQ